MQFAIFIIIFLPAVVGVMLPVLKIKNRNLKNAVIAATLIAEVLLNIFIASNTGYRALIWDIAPLLKVAVAVDEISVIFSFIATVGWLLVGIYSFEYMKHEKNEDRFYCFFLIVLSTLLAMDFADGLITMYIAFEMLTLASVPLVIHEMTKEAVAAAMKFLFYSIGGAFLRCV